MRIENLEFRIRNKEFRTLKCTCEFSILHSKFLILFCVSVVLWFAGITAQAGEESTRNAMKESLVYLEISSYGYDQIRPWRTTDVQQKSGVGTAVGDNTVITPAWNLLDAKFIKVKVFGQNEYIPAKIKVIDYELDLALVEFEPNALKKPLKPVKFADKFQRGAKLNYYWLNSTNELNAGQGYLDRAEVRHSTVSYSQFLNLIVTNTSQETGTGQLYCDGTTVVGIACWADETKEAGIIPAAIINGFLTRAKEPNYPGVPAVGFATDELLNPATRTYLKMPKMISGGVLVTDVYNLGTGAPSTGSATLTTGSLGAGDSLEPNDVIIAIDGKEIDAYGKFTHSAYDRISFHYLITSHKPGDVIAFDIWRDGKQQLLRITAKKFDVRQMLVPYYEYSRQPEYVVSGGFVFQKLTRSYLTYWGKDWTGKVTPHLLHYFRDMAFKPTAERKDIVILSYTLPAQINLGYIDLVQLVVSKVNGMPISSIDDFVKAQRVNPDSKYDVVEFELDNPTVVLPRQQLPQADALIATSYGIRKLVNIEK